MQGEAGDRGGEHAGDGVEVAGGALQLEGAAVRALRRRRQAAQARRQFTEETTQTVCGHRWPRTGAGDRGIGKWGRFRVTISGATCFSSYFIH